MDWDRVIYNGTVVNDDGMQRADIYIRDGRVAAVTSERLPGTVGEATDASDRYILPGLIETHVHSRDGRLATGEKEDFRSSTAAAAATGITTVFEMPNCTPTIHSAESLRDLVSVIQPKAHADFCVWGLALGDANLASLPALAEAGCVAFKFFWGYAVDHRDNSLIYNYREGMDNVLPPPDDGQIYRLFRAVKATGKRLGIHAENFSIVRALTQEVLATGAQDYAALLRTRPVSCETSIIDTAIDMAKELSMPLHVLHVGVGDGVEHLRRAKADGVEFAMVRIGLRGYGSGSIMEDAFYAQNIDGAMAAGIETGVYFFAQAITVEEAIEEADFVISLLEGHEIDGPVAYDWEMHDSTYRVYGTTPEMATACAVAFCERIAEAGYTPMVYAGQYVSYIKYDQGALEPYLSWYPEYKSESSELLYLSLIHI